MASTKQHPFSSKSDTPCQLEEKQCNLATCSEAAPSLPLPRKTLTNCMCHSCAPSTPAHAVFCYGHILLDARSPGTVCRLRIQWNTKVCESETTF